MTSLEAILATLDEVATQAGDLVELRYQRRTTLSLLARDQAIAVAERAARVGVHVRVLCDGTWGSAVTERVDVDDLRAAIARARRNARATRTGRSGTDPQRRGGLATGCFRHPGGDELAAISVEDKVARLRSWTAAARAASPLVTMTFGRYREIVEETAVVTTDGARAAQHIVRPDAFLVVMASDGEHDAALNTGAGVAGGWNDLWSHPALAAGVEATVARCVELLRAPSPSPGRGRVVLAPALTGLLCHEAVGHVLEYDCVHGASIGRRPGARIGSELVTVLDAGVIDDARPAGFTYFDDEGVAAQTAPLVTEGRITGYLHDSASAAATESAATGNARAWTCADAPLIRMRNTYLRAGEVAVDELIDGIDDGYVFAGEGSGQSEANGSIVLTCPYGWRIERGRRTHLVRGAALTGNAVEILSSIDGVSREFAWAMGTELCDKGGQSARVDAGGGYVRCALQVTGS